MRAIILKEFRELRRDRRTVAMLIVLPLLLLIIFGFAANFTYTTITATAVGDTSAVDALTAQIPSDKIKIVDTQLTDDPTDAKDKASAALRDDKSDIAIVALPGAKPTVYIDGSNIFAAQTARADVAAVGDQVTAVTLYNPDLKTSWAMVPAIIGMILTFIGTMVTSIGLVKERQTGTLEQLAVMPFRPVEVIIGKVVPYFILASFDMVVITLLGIWIFGLPFNGNPFEFAIGAAIFLVVVLGLGVLISTVSRNAGQAIQTAIFFLLPQILLSGMIFPLDAMAAGVRWIGYILPLTYFNKIAQGVILRGESFAALWPNFVILTVMAAVIFTGASLRLRASLTPHRSRRSRSEADGAEVSVDGGAQDAP